MKKRGNNLDFNLLKVFIIVYRQKNLKKAARILNYTAPAISIKLSKLKQQLSGELFLKTPYGVEPTVLADELYQKVAPLIFQLESTIEELDEFTPEEIAQPIRIDLGQHFQPWLCPELFNAIRRDNKNVEIHFAHFTRESFERLRNQEIDICIQFSSSIKLEKDILELPIGFDHMAMMASKDHPFKGNEGRLSELLQYQLAMIQSGLPLPKLGPLAETIKELDLPFNIGCKAASMDGLKTLIEQTEMLTPCSVKTAKLYSSSMRYIEVSDFPHLSHHRVSAYILQRNRHGRLSKWLINIIKEQFLS